jgi:hypothetical protein
MWKNPFHHINGFFFLFNQYIFAHPQIHDKEELHGREVAKSCLPLLNPLDTEIYHTEK